jgi:hypothetical protein
VLRAFVVSYPFLSVTTGFRCDWVYTTVADLAATIEMPDLVRTGNLAEPYESLGFYQRPRLTASDPW